MKNKNFDTATPSEIAGYLNYLHNLAWEKSNHKTDDVDGDYNAYCVWKNLYDFIFSEDISKKLCKRFGKLDYYDPDTTYYSDITAYIDAFTDIATKHKDEITENNNFPTFEEYQNLEESEKFSYEQNRN